MTPEARGRARAERRIAEKAREWAAWARQDIAFVEAAGVEPDEGVVEARAKAERYEELAAHLEQMADKREAA